MLTRCPHCQTAFRVTTEQLKVRQGRVRCGACQSVFDALDSLADEARREATAAVEAVPEEVEEVEEVEFSAEPDEPPPRRWPWAIGVLLLFGLGAGQLLYVFRVELAAVAPELRPALVSGCQLIGCTVPRPSRPELAGIVASDLVPASGDHLLLTATLKNRAPFAQEYPHLELTLTDTHDTALLRKVLAPADWLPAGQDPAAGFAARGEVDTKLLLEAPGVPAAGYRLYLFYP